MKKKLKKHKTQIEELREMAMKNNIKMNNNNNESSLRGRTYSEISLQDEAFEQHEINKELMNEEGSEFIGFRNEMFQPTTKTNNSNSKSTSNNKGRRPSVGPCPVASPRSGQQRDSIRSDVFPAPPFELLNPVFEIKNNLNSSNNKNNTPLHTSLATPPPPPPPPPPPVTTTTQIPNMVSPPNKREPNSLERHNNNQENATSPLDSLLGEFKNRIKKNHQSSSEDSDSITSQDDGSRLVRASTFSNNNKLASMPQQNGKNSSKYGHENPVYKQSRSLTGVNTNKKVNNKNRPSTAGGRTPNIQEENRSSGGDDEFIGFRNMTFNPDMPEEASSRF